MQSKTLQMARSTLTITILAVLAIIVSLTLEFGGSHVPIHLFVAFAATAAASGVGWVAVTCTGWIMRHIDSQCERFDKRCDDITDGLNELRGAMADFVSSVEEYGDQRATAGRLKALESLTHLPEPTENGRVVTQIRRDAIRRHVAP